MSKASKIIAWAFLGMITFLVIVVLGAGSNWGLRTAAHFANKVEGLSIQDIEGSIYSELVIKRVDFSVRQGIDLRTQNTRIDLNLECLLDFAACLRSVHIDKIALTLPPANPSEEATEPTETYIRLPLPVDILAFSLGQFELYQQQSSEKAQASTQKILTLQDLAIEDFSAFLEFDVKRIRLASLHLHEQEVTNAGAEPANSADSQAPFALKDIKEMFAHAPRVTIPNIFIPIELGLERVELQALCWGVDAQSSNQASNQTSNHAINKAQCVSLYVDDLSLQEQVLTSELRVEGPKTFEGFGLLADSLAVSAQVDFAQAFQHELSILLTQSEADNATSSLHINSAGAINQLTLEAEVNAEQKRTKLLSAKLAGQWSQAAFPINVQLQSESLYPLNRFLISPLDIEAKHIDVALNGDWNAYDLRASAQLLANMSAQTGLSNLSLEATASPADLKMNIKELRSDGALGDIQISGVMHIKPLEEQAQLSLSSELLASLADVNIGVFKSDTPSDIDGKLEISHILTEAWMQGQLRCLNIDGTVADVALSLVCDVDITKTGELNIKRFIFRQGGNRVDARGSIALNSSEYMNLSLEQILSSSAKIDFSAQIEDASLFTEDLSGSLSLDGETSGTLGAPQVTVNAQVRALSYINFGLEEADLAMSIDANDNYQTQIDLNIAELATDGFVINNANIRASGNQTAHSLSLAMQSKDVSLEQSLSGGLQIEAGSAAQNNEQTFVWQGQWDKGSIQLPFTTLTLDSSPEINASLLRSDQSSKIAFNMNEHCWLSKPDNSLCFSDLTYQDDEARARIDVRYDAAAIARHYDPELILPDTRLPLSSMLNIQYSSQDGLFASAFNNIIGGEIETPQHLLELTAIVANLTLNDDTLSSAIFAGTQQTGTIGLQSQLDLRPEQRTHSGRLRIDNFDLSLFQRFIPSTQSILGMVNANIGFDGELSQPQLSGGLNIDSGELILDAYTYPLTDFNHAMTFSGQTSQMTGGFKLGKGSSEYQASLDMQNGFSVEGELQGKSMQFAFQDSSAEVSPDIAFKLSPTDLSLKGDIAIPQAAIKIKALPESAKTPSSDTIIIGKPVPPPVVPLAMDIQLNILIDQAKRKFVTVDVLDLEASLSGDLDLSVIQKRSKNSESFQPLRTTLNGQVNVLDGSYEAYGQMLVVQTGKVFFNGEPSLPQFNIKAIRNPLNTEGGVIAGLHITGNPVVPRVELFSEPPMTQAKQLSYLLQGKDLTASSGSGGQTDAALINALVSFGVGRSENRIGQVGKALGFDSLNLQTAGAGENSQVQISGRIAEDIQITYGIGVFDQAPEVILKYQILPQLFIEAKSGVESAVDMFYQISRGEN